MNKFNSTGTGFMVTCCHSKLVDLGMLSDLASKFYRQIFTFSTRGYADEDNTTIRDDAIVLQILMVGPRLPSTDICYRPLIPHQLMQELSAKLSLFVCRLLPVHSWSTVLKPAGMITLYQYNYNQLVLMQHC